MTDPEKQESTTEVREALDVERRAAMKTRRVFRGRGIYSEPTRRRTMEHARARIEAGATLRRIANDLGLPPETLGTWLTPRAPNLSGLRPVTIIDEPGVELPPISGPTVIMPNGVRVCGLTIDQVTALMKVLR